MMMTLACTSVSKPERHTLTSPVKENPSFEEVFNISDRSNIPATENIYPT